MKAIDMTKHVLEGGTVVTNFMPERFPVFREAIKRFGNPEIVVVNRAAPPAPPHYGGSLHYCGDKFDLSDFWDVVEKVQLELETNATKTAGDDYDRAMSIL